MRARRSALLLLAIGACARPATPPNPTPAPPPERPQAAEPDTIPVPRHVPRASVRLVFVGDINVGTATLKDGVPPDSGRTLFRGAKPFLAGDLVIGNFEGVLADTGTTEKCEPNGKPMPHGRKGGRRAGRHPHAHRHRRMVADTVPHAGCYAFRTPTYLAPRLVEAGFTHLNLANNHANDFGLAGRASTESTFAALGVGTYGPLGRVVVDTVRRGDSVTTVGVIGFTTYPFAYDLLDIERSRAVIDSLRPLVDVLIVTFHGGTEGADAIHLAQGPEFLGREPRGDLRAWAHAVIDAGADAVVGHGPHVLRGIEFRRGKPIVYSLGNFATYRGFSLSGPLGITGVLRLDLAGDRSLQRARLEPLRQEPLQGPEPDPARAAIALVRDLSAADFGPDAARVADDGTISPP